MKKLIVLVALFVTAMGAAQINAERVDGIIFGKEYTTAYLEGLSNPPEFLLVRDSDKNALVYYDGTAWVELGGGSGDVTAANPFGSDNKLIKSDGTGKGVQSTGITIDDSNNVSGIGNIDLGGNSINNGSAVTVTGRVNTPQIRFEANNAIGNAVDRHSVGFKTGNVFYLQKVNESNELGFNFNALTADRTITFPDADVDLGNLSGTDDQTLAEVLAQGATTGGSDLIISDNDAISIGTGSDLQILHNGSNTYFDNYTSRITFRDADNSFAQDFIFDFDNGTITAGGIVLGDSGTDDQTASEVTITDSGDNFTATDVEGALAELAASGGTPSTGSVTLDMMAHEDFGDFTNYDNSNGFVIDNGVITNNKIADSNISFAKINPAAIASQAAAEAGTSSSALMTPQRTAQAIAALAGSGTDSGQTKTYATGSSETLTLSSFLEGGSLTGRAKVISHTANDTITTATGLGQTGRYISALHLLNGADSVYIKNGSGATLINRTIAYNGSGVSEDGIWATTDFMLSVRPDGAIEVDGSDIFLAHTETAPNPELYTVNNWLARGANEANSSTGLNVNGVTLTVETTIVAEGTYSALLTSTDGGSDRMEINLTLPINTNYTIYWYEANGTNSVDTSGWAGFSTVGSKTATGNTSGGMTEFKRQVTTNGTVESRIVRFYNNGAGGGTCYVDAFSYKEGSL